MGVRPLRALKAWLGSACMIACLVSFLVHGLVWPQEARAQKPSGDLAKVIAQLNAAAAKFKSAQADFSWDVYQAVVQEHDVQSGVIYFERQNGSTRMAAYLQPGGGDASKTVVYEGNEVQFYQPAIKQMTILNAGSNQAQAEAFLTLGFGGSGAGLETTWNVSLIDMEMMNGVQVAKLDLQPKAPNIAKIFTRVTIWLDPSRGISFKQIFYEPSGDMRTTTYSNIKYNQPISKNVFEIKTAPGTTYQRR